MSAYDAWLEGQMEDFYGDYCRSDDEGIESRMDAFIPFTHRGVVYALETFNWQLGDDHSESVLYKRDALGCWYLIDIESDEAQSCFESAAWDAADKAWAAGNFMTDEEIEAYNSEDGSDDYID